MVNKLEDDALQALAYQCEIENEYEELIELEKFYEGFLSEGKLDG